MRGELEFEDATRPCPRCGEPFDLPRARVCAACSRRSSRDHYARHRERILRTVRAKAPLLTPVEKKMRRNRAYLAMYLKRGKIVRGRCEECGAAETRPIQPDLEAPLVVVWACRDHFVRLSAGVEAGNVEPPPPPRQPRKEARTPRPRWSADAREIEAILAQLDPRVAAAITGAASVLRGLRLTPGSPLYRMRLIAVYQQWLKTNGRVTGSAV